MGVFTSKRRVKASPIMDQIRVPKAEYQMMRRLMYKYKDYKFEQEFVDQLKMSTFSNWEYTEFELLLFMRHMFYEMNFVEKFKMEENTLINFLLQVYKRYNRNPFHNFQHCFMVGQMMYVLMHINSLWDYFSHSDLLAMLLAAICHDLDHPGLSNRYQEVFETELFEKCEGHPPLENHHWEETVTILNNPKCDILKHIDPKDRWEVLTNIQRLILATDMSSHMHIMSDLDKLVKNYDKSNPAHERLLQSMMLKISDLSNEARPLSCGDRWVNQLYKEFFYEASLLRKHRKEVPPHMDPRVVKKSTNQVFFLQTFPLKMAKVLEQILPEIHKMFVDPIDTQMKLYKSPIRDAYETELLELKNKKLEKGLQLASFYRR